MKINKRKEKRKMWETKEFEQAINESKRVVWIRRKKSRMASQLQRSGCWSQENGFWFGECECLVHFDDSTKWRFESKKLELVPCCLWEESSPSRSVRSSPSVRLPADRENDCQLELKSGSECTIRRVCNQRKCKHFQSTFSF